MMSPEELNRYRSREFVRLAKSNFPELGGQKLNTMIDATFSDTTPGVAALRKSLFDRLSYKKVGRLCDLCKIDYDPKMKVIKLTKKAGKIHRYMGFKGCDGSTLLHPEEALFLMDCGDAEIYLNNFPIGFNEALSRLLTDFCMPFRNYLVYAHLIRAGYIVRRHTEENCHESAFESRKREKHMTGSFENDYVPPVKKSNVWLMSKFDVDDAKPCSSRDDLSGIGLNNLDCSEPRSLQTRWDFDHIRIPDDFGGSFIMLEEPKEEYLPFPLKYGNDRLFLRRDSFTKSGYKSTLLNKQTALIDEQRRADRRSFYRPKTWVFWDVQSFETWEEFKSFKLRVANKPSNAQRHHTASDIYFSNYVQKSPSVLSPRRNLAKQCRFQILYDIHISISGFKLTKPTQPSSYLVVTDVDEPPPTNSELGVLNKSVGIKNAIRFAVVDNGEILFFDMTLCCSPSVSKVLCQERGSEKIRESFANEKKDSLKQGPEDADTLRRQKILYAKILLMKYLYHVRNDVSNDGPKMRKIPLHQFHVNHGAKMVPFVDFLLPLQYTNQSLIESHLHTRSNVSLFDVSHMLQTNIYGKHRLEFIESLVPSDVKMLEPNHGALTVFTNDKGGIRDDLIVNNTSEGYLYVVTNAGCIDKDIKHMQDHAQMFRDRGYDVTVEHLDQQSRCLIALQGPAVSKIFHGNNCSIDASKLYFMTSSACSVFGIDDCRITRCGYTGEDGFEISVDSRFVTELCEKLLNSKDACVKLAGLGARDTLRLESGLCLYGNDIDETTTPVEASLAWLIRGAVILNKSGDQVGQITSGCPSPSLKLNIAMGYCSADQIDVGTEFMVLLSNNQTVNVTVAKMPFVPTHYYMKPKTK